MMNFFYYQPHYHYLRVRVKESSLLSKFTWEIYTIEFICNYLIFTPLKKYCFLATLMCFIADINYWELAQVKKLCLYRKLSFDLIIAVILVKEVSKYDLYEITKSRNYACYCTGRLYVRYTPRTCLNTKKFFCSIKFVFLPIYIYNKVLFIYLLIYLQGYITYFFILRIKYTRQFYYLLQFFDKYQFNTCL